MSFSLATLNLGFPFSVWLQLITPIILCGGNGTRLWPVSRSQRPKPFLPLVDDSTLFEATLHRNAGAGFAAPVIVTGRDHIDHVERQSSPHGKTIIEPTGKNTAPAVALAAARLPDDAVMLVCPSDHYIGNNAAYLEAVERAVELAGQGWLTTFGIVPTSPETGFGYIRRGSQLGRGCYCIERFVEKPSLERAEAFLAAGGYSWNSGIFCFTAGRFRAELAAQRPEMTDRINEAVAGGREEGLQFLPDSNAFSAIEGESLDYAVMEHAMQAAVVTVDMDWSDVGNWSALQQARKDTGAGDADGNVLRGRGELIDCHNVMVESDRPRVSVIGLQDVVVVVNGDEVLVTTAQGAQKVSRLSGALNQ